MISNISAMRARLQFAMQSTSISTKSETGVTDGKEAADKASVAVDVTVTTAIDAVSTPRTLADAKQEFYDYLDSLTLSAGLSKTAISVNITEAAFGKMLADPEYMQKMKDLCARDLCDPNWVKLPPAAINITIDADVEEEYLASSYGSAVAEGKANPDGFWTRRTTKNKEMRDANQKRSQEKREMMEFLQERAESRKRLNTEYFASLASIPGIDSYSTGKPAAKAEGLDINTLL